MVGDGESTKPAEERAIAETTPSGAATAVEAAQPSPTGPWAGPWVLPRDHQTKDFTGKHHRFSCKKTLKTKDFKGKHHHFSRGKPLFEVFPLKRTKLFMETLSGAGFLY